MSTSAHIVCPVCSNSYRVKEEPVPVTPFTRWCDPCLSRAIEKVDRVREQLRYEESKRGQDLLRRMTTKEFDALAKYMGAHG